MGSATVFIWVKNGEIYRGYTYGYIKEKKIEELLRKSGVNYRKFTVYGYDISFSYDDIKPINLKELEKILRI